MRITTVTVGAFATNCYLVCDASGSKGFVIDPGAEGERIVSEIRKSGMSVQAILLTHGHYDHFGAVDTVARECGAPVWMSADDRCYYTTVPSFFGNVDAPQTPVSRLLRAGESVSAGTLTLQVLSSPGHTPGGLCFYADGVLFSGDSLFCCGVGRCDLPGGNWEVLIDSIQTGLLTLPPQTKVYPGHGGTTTIEQERKLNPYL